MQEMPQGAPAPTEAAPAQGGGEEQIVKDITAAGEVMAKLAQALGQKMPELGQRMEAVLGEYQAIIEEAMQGGGAPAAPQGPAPGGMGQVSMEGGASGRPMS